MCWHAVDGIHYNLHVLIINNSLSHCFLFNYYLYINLLLSPIKIVEEYK